MFVRVRVQGTGWLCRPEAIASTQYVESHINISREVVRHKGKPSVYLALLKKLKTSRCRLCVISGGNHVVASTFTFVSRPFIRPYAESKNLRQYILAIP